MVNTALLLRSSHSQVHHDTIHALANPPANGCVRLAPPATLGTPIRLWELLNCCGKSSALRARGRLKGARICGNSLYGAGKRRYNKKLGDADLRFHSSGGYRPYTPQAGMHALDAGHGRSAS